MITPQTKPLWQIAEIKLALQDQLINIDTIDIRIEQITIDSRGETDNGLFIALDGTNNDGHNFLGQAFANGCVAAIVHKIPDDFQNDKRLILVKNSLQALNQLASFSRSRTQAKIIAITGSAGKTSVKEMLKNVFINQGKCFASIGNLNNHFGLPLSLANMPRDCEFGIFEMGMNHLGEIKHLTHIAKPHIAIITLICPAHIGNFKNEEEIALAKSEIFSGVVDNGFVILNADDNHLDFLTNQAIKHKVPISNIITFGSSKISNIRLMAIEKSINFNSKIDVFIAQSKQQISYLINNISYTTIFNSLIIIACLELIGKDFTKGLDSLKTLQTTKGRGNLIDVKKNGIKFTIVDDSYNANPASIQTGLKFLADLKNHQTSLQKPSRAIAFIGDMLELGDFSYKEHKKIANYISSYNIDKVLLIGPFMKDLVTEIAPEKLIGHFLNSSLASAQLEFQPQNGDIIFVKGSRGIRMEKIIEKLLS